VTDERDDMPPLALGWDETRTVPLRTFSIVLFDGTIRRVFAHYWNCDNPGGHLNFYTVAPSGRQLIRDSFNGRLWAELKEITPGATIAKIERMYQHASESEGGQQAFEKMKKSSRQVH
jgi:hypothetical protein